ncbi:MAG: hypothetical protein IT261_10940 [Saprospiraceae bacterium]|nr:hypothetical protein [Saprospiraceae bacterium]
MLTKTTFFLSTLALCFCLSTSLQAQSGKPKREVGLQFSSLNFNDGAFGGFYKKELSAGTYRRIRFASGSIDLALREDVTDFHLNLALAIGREKRKALDSKLDFYQGPEFSFNLAAATVGDDDMVLQITPSFGWVFGLQHSFNERWAINIETIPGVYVSADINNATGLDSEGLYFGVGGSNYVNLGIVRKF